MFFRETPPGRPRLPRHELRAPGHADLLDCDVPLGAEVIGLKGGGYLAGFALSGLDLEGATAEELKLAEDALARASSTLGSGWVVHLHHRRAPEPAYPCDGGFEDVISRRVEATRRERFESRDHFASRVRLWLAYYAPVGVEGYLRARADLEAFEAAIGSFSAALGAALTLRRLDVAAMLDELARAVCGRSTPTLPPPREAFLDSLLSTDVRVRRDALRVGDRWIVPLRIAALPERQLFAGALVFLAGLPLPFTYSARLVLLDPHHAESRIAKIRGTWETTTFSWSTLLRSIVSGKGAAKREREERTRDGHDAAAAVHDRNVRNASEALQAAMEGTLFAYLSPVLLACGDSKDSAHETARALVHQLERHRIRVEVDRYNALQAYLGHLPGNAWANARRFFQPLRACAALVPLTSPWRGSRRCPHPRFRDRGPLAVVESGSGDSFFLNLHSSASGHGDLGHTAIFGPPGSGKSVLLNFLAAQGRRFPGARVFALDVDRSQLTHCLAVGGRAYDLGDPQLELAPLASADAARPTSIARTMDWLLGLWDLQSSEPIPAGERQHLEEALLEVAAMAPEHRNLSALRLKVQSTRLRQLLRPYTAGGEYGHLLDGVSDSVTASRYTVVELRPLLGQRRELTTPVFRHLLDLVRESLDPASLSWVLIDEGSLLLDEPILRAGIRDMLTTFRKLGASVVFATQSLAHLRDPELRQIFAEMAPTTIYLPNPRAASSREVRASYEAAGLTAQQIERIAGATPKRDYFVVQPEGARLVRLALSPLELAVYGVSNPADVERVKTLHAERGERWLDAWLRERGLEREARNLSKEGDPS